MTDTTVEAELPLEPPTPALEPIGDYGSIEYRLRKRLVKVREALQRLTTATGTLPENGSGTVQGQELNRAYMKASRVLEEESIEPNY